MILQMSLTSAEKRRSSFPFTCCQLASANVVGFLCQKDKLQIHHILLSTGIFHVLLSKAPFYPVVIQNALLHDLCSSWCRTWHLPLRGVCQVISSVCWAFPSRVLPALHTLHLLRAYFVSPLLKALSSTYLIYLSQWNSIYMCFLCTICKLYHPSLMEHADNKMKSVTEEVRPMQNNCLCWPNSSFTYVLHLPFVMWNQVYLLMSHNATPFSLLLLLG